MKAIGILAAFLLAVFLVFAATGGPEFAANSSGVSYYTNGDTIFDFWSAAESQNTQRKRIEAEARTRQTIIVQEEETKRHLIFWQYFPLAILALALGASAVAWALRRDGSTPIVAVTVTRLQAPPGLRRLADDYGLEDVEYQYDGTWRIVEPQTGNRYTPPPHLAQLPGPR